MVPGFTKTSPRCAVGLYLGEERITWSVARQSLFGRPIVQTHEELCGRSEWRSGLQRVLAIALKGESKRTPLVVGLPPSQGFFATLPVGAKSEPAESLLARNHCCGAIPAGDLLADSTPIRMNGRRYAAVAACRRRDIHALAEIIQQLGHPGVRVELAPFALLRAGQAQSTSQLSVRLLIAQNQLLAGLLYGAQPLMWRMLPLPMKTADETAGEIILSVVRSLETHALRQFNGAELGSVVLQTPDSDDEMSAELAAEIGERFIEAQGPGPTAEAFSQALALRGLSANQAELDLARGLRPPPRLKELVPFKEAIVLTTVLACCGSFLWARGTAMEARAAEAEKRNARHALLKANDDGKLKAEKGARHNEVQAIHSFFAQRILWTDYLTQLSQTLPHSVTLVSLQAASEFRLPSANDAAELKRSLTLDFSALVPHDLAGPREVDPVLQALRATPVLKNDFPQVRLASLRVEKSRVRGSDDKGDPAIFTVICSPPLLSRGGEGGAPK